MIMSFCIAATLGIATIAPDWSGLLVHYPCMQKYRLYTVCTVGASKLKSQIRPLQVTGPSYLGAEDLLNSMEARELIL